MSPYQVAGRVGHLERRLQSPLASVVDAEAPTVPPDTTVEELFWQHLIGGRRWSVAVVDGSTYLGLARAEDLARADRDAWATATVDQIMRTDVPVATTTWVEAEAIRAMEAAGVDRLAVCDGERYVGVIGAEDIVRLEDVQRESTAGPWPPGE